MLEEFAMARPRKQRAPLTKRAIDAAKPDQRSRQEGGTDRFLWDGREHGLGVKITPAPNCAKVFIFQKSMRGRLKRVTIGHFGDLTLEAARIQARRLNGEIAEGRDPVAEAKAARTEQELRERAELTVHDLWARYWTDVVSVENRPSTAAEKQRMWKTRIKPKLGSSKIKDVTELDVSGLVRGALRIDDDGNVIGGRAAAGNLYRLLHHLFSKALVWGMQPRALGNPLDGVTEPKVERRQRLLTANEVGALVKELDRASAKKTELPVIVAVVKSVLLTGARISEILNLRWEDVRAEDLELHLRDTKTGFSRRPISAEALAAIRTIRRAPGEAHVFPSPRRAGQPVDYATVRKAFGRIAGRAGISNCTLHTIRHWFSTLTANSISNPRVGMALTGHKSHASYLNYVHGDREQARKLADELGQFTAALGRKKRNVVPLRGRGAS